MDSTISSVQTAPRNDNSDKRINNALLDNSVAVSTTPGLDSWMVHDPQSMKSQMLKDNSTIISSSASSTTWFDPLENIISSGSSSSTGSPLTEQIKYPQQPQVLLPPPSAVHPHGMLGSMGGMDGLTLGMNMNPNTNQNSTTTTATNNNNNSNNIFNTDNLFNTPSGYSNYPILLPSKLAENNTSIKKETQDDLATIKMEAGFNPPSYDEQGSSSTTTLSSNRYGRSASLSEKKKRAPRKRLTPYQKQAHNKIEKRYRININTKIAKLQQIIPWVASEQTAFEVSESIRRQEQALEGAATTAGSSNCYNASPENTTTSTSTSEVASTKLNKSMILEKAVDYILYLQNNERLYEMEVQRLENELESLRKTVNSQASEKR